MVRSGDQARRTATDEDGLDASIADEFDVVREIAQQLFEIRGFGQRRLLPGCELKSQYGHLRTHHGKWTYSDSGGVSIIVGRSQRRCVQQRAAYRFDERGGGFAAMAVLILQRSG